MTGDWGSPSTALPWLWKRSWRDRVSERKREREREGRWAQGGVVYYIADLTVWWGEKLIGGSPVTCRGGVGAAIPI